MESEEKKRRLSEGAYTTGGSRGMEHVEYGSGGNAPYAYDGFDRMAGISCQDADPAIGSAGCAIIRSVII